MSVFFDTSVLLAGLVDFGPQSAPAQSLMHGVAEKRLENVSTAWHCCLEFLSIATHLPPEFRLSAADAVLPLHDEVFNRMAVHDLPQRDRLPMLQAAGRDGVTGGRIHDSHIAEVARTIAADVVVTDNRRHFISALRYGMRVETPQGVSLRDQESEEVSGQAALSIRGRSDASSKDTASSSFLVASSFSASERTKRL